MYLDKVRVVSALIGILRFDLFLLQCGITILIEPISTIPHYFLQHQQQGVYDYSMHISVVHCKKKKTHV